MKKLFNYLIITVFSSLLAIASNVSELQGEQKKHVSQTFYDLDDTSSEESLSDLISELKQHSSPSYSFSDIWTSSVTYFTDLYKTMLSVKEEQPSKIYLPYFPEEIWKSIFKFLTEKEQRKGSSITKGLRQTIMPLWTSDYHTLISSTYLPNIKKDLLFIKDLGIRHIKFNNTSMYIDLLETLGGCTNLESLAFYYISSYNRYSDLTTRIPGGFQIQRLSGLTNLTTLSLMGICIHKHGFQGLSNLTNLTTLGLRACSTYEHGLQGLTNLTNLTFLDLQGWRMEDKDLRHLAQLTNLTNLNLEDNAITGEGKDFRHLAPLTNLTDLNLSRNKISNITRVAFKKNFQRT